jgi:hypothetical protein
MIALYDHIQELRAELRGCVMSHHERAIIEAELARAIAECRARSRCWRSLQDRREVNMCKVTPSISRPVCRQRKSQL